MTLRVPVPIYPSLRIIYIMSNDAFTPSRFERCLADAVSSKTREALELVTREWVSSVNHHRLLDHMDM